MGITYTGEVKEFNLFEREFWVGKDLVGNCSGGYYLFKTVGPRQEICIHWGIIDGYYHTLSRCSCLEGREIYQSEEFKTVKFYNLPIEIRRAYYKVAFLGQELTDEEENIFVYGEEQGEIINDENRWLDEHLVLSRTVTRSLRDKYGNFKMVSCAYTNVINAFPFIVPKEQMVVDYYIINGTYAVRVWEDKTTSDCGVDSIELKNIILVAPRFTSARERLCIITGSPERLVNIVLNQMPVEERALNIIGALKLARMSEFEEDIAEALDLGDICSQKNAIAQLVGTDVFYAAKIPSLSNKYTISLARYLLGREEL